MVDILNSIKNTEADIYANLNDTQKASLNEILEKYKNSNEEKKNGKNGNQIILSEENANEEDDIIISKIEDVVNENFTKKKIINIKIDQVNDDIFKFNDKNAVLFIENDILKVREKGVINFEDWILQNFGTGTNPKSTKKVTANGTTPTAKAPAVVEKKTVEKKVTTTTSTATTQRNKTPTPAAKKA